MFNFLSKSIFFTKTNAFIILAFIFFSLFFTYFAWVDIYISSLFFSFESQQFTYVRQPIIRFLRNYNSYLLLIIPILGIFSIIIKRQFLLKALLLFLITSIFAGGLVINVIMKENIGRSRPLWVEEFGGENEFTPVWAFSNACDNNCSFPSGHATTGFLFMSPAYATNNKRLRNFWLFFGAFLGLFLGLGRVIEGRHFISDIIFAGLVVFFFLYNVHLIFEKYSISEKIYNKFFKKS